MAEKMCPGPVNGAAGFREAVCVHTKKVYDQCRSRDCMRDLRVYLPIEDQCFIDGNAVSVKPRSAELLTAVMDVEPVAFRRGFYSVDIRFYYKVSVEACTGVGHPRILEGLSIYDKRCILFGSEGGVRIFSSRFSQNQMDPQLAERSNRPTAVLEAVDAILLDARVVYPTQPCNCGCCCELREVPRAICGCFGGQDLALDSTSNQLVVTIGQFSIIKLERDIQLLMPAFDVCMPQKDCCDTGIGGDTSEDPCEVFSRFAFPVEEFFPPYKEHDYRERIQQCNAAAAQAVRAQQGGSCGCTSGTNTNRGNSCGSNSCGGNTCGGNTCGGNTCGGNTCGCN